MNVLEMSGAKPQSGDVGIEIEVEGTDLPGNLRGTSKFDKLWKVVHDGSLRGEAFEYVLRRPVFITKLKDALGEVEASYTKCKSTVNNSVRAGVHVHINCQHLSMKQVMNFACLYFILEEVLLMFCNPTRRGNHFCLRAKDAEYQVYNLQGVLGSRDIINFSNRNVRYSSLNMCSLATFGSMEFRSLESGDLDKIYQWAKILLDLRDVAMTYDNPIEIVESMSQDGYDNFLMRAFGENLKCFSNIPDIDGMVLNGARHAQDMAYGIDWSTIDEGWVKRTKMKKPSVDQMAASEILERALRGQRPQRQDNGVPRQAPIPDPFYTFNDQPRPNPEPPLNAGDISDVIERGRREIIGQRNNEGGALNVSWTNEFTNEEETDDVEDDF